MTATRWIFGFASLALVFVSQVRAADQAKIDEAIRKAMQRLWDEQYEDGSWEYRPNSGQRVLGMTALAALALYENGTLPTDPRLRAAIKYVRDNSLQNRDTYSVSLATILLARVGNREDRALVRSLAAKLIAGQTATGSWGYEVPILRSEQERDRSLRQTPAIQIGDLSVTQFAVLALWQAQQVGANVEDALRKVRLRLAWGQTATGGWSYKGIRTESDTPSMTAAGAFMWVVSSAWEIREARRNKQEKVVAREPRPRGDSTRAKLRKQAAATQDPSERDRLLARAAEAKETPPADVYDALERAVADYQQVLLKAGVAGGPEAAKRLEEELPDALPPTLEVNKSNPLVDDKPLRRALERCGQFASSQMTAASFGGNWLYYVWSVERLGVLLGQDTFGTTNWFELGSKTLLSRQNPDGSWGVTPEQPNYEKSLIPFQPDTAFALLFLKKANLGSEATKLLNPDPDRPFYIEGRSDSRHDRLESALAAAKPGETIVVRGDGPFYAAALVIDKPVTIRAEQGYRPVFVYRRPKDRLGIDVDVTAQPNAKNLFVVQAGPVILEGLALQMDSPSIAAKVNWTVIECGPTAELRLLNCSLSESTRGASLGVVLRQSPRAFFRNTLFVGFNPAIEVTTGKQCNMLMKDCVAYGIKTFQAAGDGEVNLWMYESTIHAEKAFDFASLNGPLTVVVENSVFKADQLIAQLGPTTSVKRSWDGHQLNLYDVRQWVAKGDSRATSVQELAGWRKYWSAMEKNSLQSGAPFAVSRLQIGSFRHEVTAGDWGIDHDVLKRIMTIGSDDQIGANVYVVGAGDRYAQFRDSQEYGNWFRGVTRPSERAQAEQAQ
jgi:hypothetical protein